MPGLAPMRLRYLAMPYVEILAELGRWDDLARFVELLEPILDVTPCLRPVVERAEGRARISAGDVAGAAVRLEAALAGFNELTYRFEAARTAELLAAVADDAQRIDLLEGARETYGSLGAIPALERVTALLAQPKRAR